MLLWQQQQWDPANKVNHDSTTTALACMAQVINQKWHGLDLEQWAWYQALAEQDREWHCQEKYMYLQYQHAACKEVYQELLEEVTMMSMTQKS